ncbi:MAG: AAA family ATPase [Bacteroidetes bacterium]|nr:AAA family ATPase [Bacteroidota bacterium]
MYLKSLTLLHFRNYEEAGINFSERINCFTGLNGSGKTNLLDAIHYLALCKSFLNPLDSQNIRFEEPFFVVQGVFEDGSGTEDNIICSLKRGQRKVFKRNGNALLKRMAEAQIPDDGTLEVLDMQMEQFGMPIFIARKAFIRELLPFFNNYYEQLSGGAEKVELIYQSKLHDHSLADLLKQSFSRERYLGHTTVGIHKDDLDLQINGHSLKRRGSQGQQKTFLIALKLAEYVFLDRASGKKPMLILDDVHDKLDADRVFRLMEIVCGNGFGQLFITDTGAGRMDDLFAKRGLPYKMFMVENGTVVSSV